MNREDELTRKLLPFRGSLKVGILEACESKGQRKSH